MTLGGLHHIALGVPDVPTAESFYCELFDLDVLFREGSLDGDFGALPEGMEWPEADAAGVDPGLTFVGRDDLALALAHDPSTPEGGHVDHIALTVSDAELGAICDRARELDCGVDQRETAAFVVDTYGIEWELNTSSPPPETPFKTLDV
ncbi:VOC family protein [Haloarchaeobius amylolyticus]|uniref:VOC family protein n=1 Tax=Haloarchaeobius amylolyticus TaxID=1198296 RepID=UPI00226FB0EB|nr:VOC family protein [Haloarchaeobius amylolyticus]